MGWFSSLFGLGERKTAISKVEPEGLQPSQSAPTSHHSDSLSLLATDPGHRNEFLRRLVREGVWILALAPDGEFDAESSDQLLGHIRQQAQVLSQNQFGKPYTYSRMGSIVLPIFSRREAANEFIKRLRLTKATAFQCLQVNPTFWSRTTFGVTRLFFNPFSNVQTELTDLELKQIRLIAEQVQHESKPSVEPDGVRTTSK